MEAIIAISNITNTTILKKRFFNNLIPDYRFKNITDIPLDFFEGSELIIFDLDSTLVVSGTVSTTQEIIARVHEINKKYRCIIFSNSFSFAHRGPKIIDIFHVDLFKSWHKKPFKVLFLQMKDKYHIVENDKVYVVGDMRTTDILFGNLNNAKTVLVAPLKARKNI